MRTLNNVDVSNKRVLLRVDFNVPLDSEGKISDDSRIRKALPTIKHLLQSCEQLIIMSHLGRPKGKVVEDLKMDKVAIRLMKLLGKNVSKVNDCVDIILPDEKIILLENLRFHKEEEKNNEAFAKKLASYADFFVNDAFGTAHRAHASTVGVTKFLHGCIGFLIEKELKNLNFDYVEKPFIVIMGGSKLSTKFPIINNLLPKVDKLLLGGAMIFNFYKALGFEIGKSLCENEQLATARLLYNNEKIVLPQDVVVATDITTSSESKNVNYQKIPADWFGLDIGVNSVKQFKKILSSAKTVFWNGPLGYFEIEKFAKSTNEIITFLSELDAKVVIGGGDSAVAIEKLGLENKFSHISTGGGASLAYIQGEELPALKALKN
ncbi:MAG: phosphoglycerate kinase [Nanoarchaeota archaeon]|nr:phosphoglycerate kinase [Nanoarchaeota archaeon]MBU1030080.1 phosphoglycerate kinase [Nanoarchaeota archaeon]MBU1850368.1 phosphoglycerate kinase [Nanoarchaeota archaeon]